ncbi:hypothetical protein A3H80_00865 [Candidatus Roizmanbacteria bacterium RIFCSPLOWO2_02_FULL_37_19]|uniref:Glycosyltransferase 2-like domain-containing protein n=1 Tax=Candidatus Roizmanbacteria bacterium RIFCSPHIGHO2_02_FULL_37_24 TaxID=1802037 RepID=A0A1F7GY82_9BACT|nr:MAG: hypothetical protein A2862_01915 [Candidatus Roizmanbacteria bacterium RIFCSPHIGHO2_01_FULL_38_41]OGK23891.1 MAG: hypothetical protein A3C24_02485 [Candidatus Roizmanbacteria bacterium RIFCSPHIGHO2_02_FULL_37_24]OGK32536.1 MAG: hypothetical protein A3E10_00735 [Candidatus Roizmanbacteria bacterium RIFCSPHIGHO2_12_FULL_37_23]OGK44231.1 MAG: hypothetical protein A2956_00055 [Candidatus Roizmanbacteria bacterium RIFCSPLOWO2_01_FULL_37_57]OGK54516.1 MAG: hypothetical protein A3H80_00865 [Ca
MKKDFLLSVVIPVFNEEGNINTLLKELIPIVSTYEYEIIFVNDGSQDKTEEEIKVFAQENKNIKLISFTRNFGHQTALTCGYQYTKGDCVVTIDADLQDPPELIHEMVKKWEKGFKIVYAKRKMREESLFKTLTADFFYNVINMLSQTPIPRNVGDFRLIDKHVVELLNHMPERFRFLRGMVAWGGFPSTYVYFDRKKRLTGETHYPLSKMIGFALNGIVSFSTRPLRIAIYVGILASIIGIVGIIYAIYRRLFLPSAYWVPGWTATFVAIMFFGGVQLITIGIIGEYIGKIYSEIQGRPQYLVKEKVNI